MIRFQYNDTIPFIFLCTVVLFILAFFDVDYLPLLVVRTTLGFFFLIFIPGFSLQAALFPKENQLTSLERIVLSVVGSIAFVPVVAYLLEYVASVNLLNILIAQTTLVGLISLAAFGVNYRVHPTQRFVIVLSFIPAYSQISRFERFALALVFIFSIIAITSAIVLLTGPSAKDQITEFFVLSESGYPDSFPNNVLQGEEMLFTIGIVNRESHTRTYELRVKSPQGILKTFSGIRLRPQENVQFDVTFSLSEIGERIPIDFELYLAERLEQPYRKLRIYVTVAHPTPQPTIVVVDPSLFLPHTLTSTSALMTTEIVTTDVVPSATITLVREVTETQSALLSATAPSITYTPTSMPTLLTLTSTPTLTASPTATLTLIRDVTETQSAFLTANAPSLTYTPSPTNTNTRTNTPTPTFSPTRTITPFLTSTPTNTPTASRTSTPTMTHTRTPTPTATFTFTPTPSIDPLSVVCPEALLPRLRVNQSAIVIIIIGLNMRVEPNFLSELLLTIPLGTEVMIVDGPVCENGLYWWKLRLPDGTEGWSAEADRETYYLEPLP